MNYDETDFKNVIDHMSAQYNTTIHLLSVLDKHLVRLIGPLPEITSEPRLGKENPSGIMEEFWSRLDRQENVNVWLASICSHIRKIEKE